MHSPVILSLFCFSDMHMHEYSTHTHTQSLPRAKEKWIERTHCLMVQCSMAALLIIIQTWKYSSNHVVSWCHDVVRWYSAENIKWSLSCWHICCPMFVVLMDRNWEIYGGICNPLKAEGNMRPGKERGRYSREVEVNWRTMIAGERLISQRGGVEENRKLCS